MDTFIKVLLLDDEPLVMSGFVANAEQDGIDITIKSSYKEAREELEKNGHKYHAVILDVKGKVAPEDTTIGISGFGQARDYLIKLSSKRDLPFYIFTGQPDYQSNKEFSDLYGKYYIKGKDNEDLLKQIIADSENKIECRIQRLFHRPLSVLERYGCDVRPMQEVLTSLYQDGSVENATLFFNYCRQIIELFFKEANKCGILHDKCLRGGRPIFSESSLFLSGKPTQSAGVKCAKSHFTPLVSETVWHMLKLTNSGSHINGEDGQDLNVAMHIAGVGSANILFTVVFELLDFVVWFDDYLKNNNDYELNKSYWEDLWVEGAVTKIQENGWGEFLSADGEKRLSLHKKFVTDHSLSKGSQIRVILGKKEDICIKKVELL